jgi:simple sugar transport system permease protein
MLARFTALPASVRYMLFAVIGLMVMAVAEGIESGDFSRLTSDSAANLMLKWSVPILLAGLGGLYSERAGVVNIGLEGMMILGTWFGAWGSIEYGAWAGIVIGLVGGALGGLLHAVATVTFGVDHIISGVAINLLAPGLVRFLSTEVWNNPTQSPNASALPKFSLPFLAGGWDTSDLLGDIDDREVFLVSDLAGFTRGLVNQLSVFTMIALALVPITAYLMWRTRFGLRLRIAGENPEAGETLGVDIYRQKYAGVIISGALAGLGGAFMAMELSGFFQQGQTGGRGYIGLAALIFGNWRPTGVLMAAVLFAYPFGMSRLDRDGTSTHALMLVIALALAAVAVWAFRKKRRIHAGVAVALAVGMIVWYLASETAPTWFTNTLPYGLVLLVLVFAAQRLRMPAADGKPYRKGGT